MWIEYLKVKCSGLQCPANISTSISLNCIILLVRIWNLPSVQNNLPDPMYTFCSWHDCNECTVLSINFYDIPMQVSRIAATKGKPTSTPRESFPSKLPRSPTDINISLSSLLFSSFEKSMCDIEAKYVTSNAISMELVAFKKVVLIGRTALVHPLNKLLSVSSKLESRNVYVHSFNCFEIPKLKFCSGSKLKMRYKHNSTPPKTVGSFRKDFHQARDDRFNKISIWFFLQPPFLPIRGGLGFITMLICLWCYFPHSHLITILHQPVFRSFMSSKGTRHHSKSPSTLVPWLMQDISFPTCLSQQYDTQEGKQVPM